MSCSIFHLVPCFSQQSPEQDALHHLHTCWCVQVGLRETETVASQLRRVDRVLASWKERKSQRLEQHRGLKVLLCLDH